MTTAEVMQRQTDSFGNPIVVKVCCSDEWTLHAPANVVKVKAMRESPGSALVESPNAVASVDDVRVGFDIDPGSSSKTWVRVTQRPNVAGEQLVEVPDTTLVRRHPTDPSLLELAPNLASVLKLGIFPQSSGGKVAVQVFAEEPTAPGLPPTVAALSPTAATGIVIQPNIEFVDENGVPGEALGLHSPDEASPTPFFLRYTGLASSVPLGAVLQSYYPDGRVIQSIPVVFSPTGIAGPYIATLASRPVNSSATGPSTALTLLDVPCPLCPPLEGDVELPSGPTMRLMVLPGGADVAVRKMTTAPPVPTEAPFLARIGHFEVVEQTAEGGVIVDNPANICVGVTPPQVRNRIGRFTVTGAPFADDQFRWEFTTNTSGSAPAIFLGDRGPTRAAGRSVQVEAQFATPTVGMVVRIGTSNSKIAETSRVFIGVKSRSLRHIVAFRLQDSTWTEAQILAQVEEASNVWSQCCLEFSSPLIVELAWDRSSDFRDVAWSKGDPAPPAIRRLTESHNGNQGDPFDDYLEAYFVEFLPLETTAEGTKSLAGFTDMIDVGFLGSGIKVPGHGILVAQVLTSGVRTLAHELGHHLLARADHEGLLQSLMKGKYPVFGLPIGRDLTDNLECSVGEAREWPPTNR